MKETNEEKTNWKIDKVTWLILIRRMGLCIKYHRLMKSNLYFLKNIIIKVTNMGTTNWKIDGSTRFFINYQMNQYLEGRGKSIYECVYTLKQYYYQNY